MRYKNKKTWFYAGFFAILFLLFYLVLTRIIPGYGEVKLPMLSYVHPFAFLDQDGKTITEKEVAGKVYVASFFFTTCPGICPEMNDNLKKVFLEYKNEPDFLILSHTVDPQTDSVSRMKHYADSMDGNSKTWRFLTGRKDSLYHMARSSYLLDDPRNNSRNIDEQFIHTQLLALVDRNGNVRKIYDGLKKTEIEELETDIGSLLKEAGGRTIPRID